MEKGNNEHAVDPMGSSPGRTVSFSLDDVSYETASLLALTLLPTMLIGKRSVICALHSLSVRLITTVESTN